MSKTFWGGSFGTTKGGVLQPLLGLISTVATRIRKVERRRLTNRVWPGGELSMGDAEKPAGSIEAASR
jgi:hypothetical protein